MKKIILGTIILFLFNPKVVYASPPGNQNDWTMVFHDEFNGTSVDHTLWGVTNRIGLRTNPNSLINWYVNDAFDVSNGTLKMMAKHQTITSDDPSYNTNYDPIKYPYTSGNLQTKVDSNSPYLVNHYWAYGYFEARLKVPSKKGTWPSFWMMAAPGGWPPEIDIMEMHTLDTRTNYMTNHKSCSYPLITYPLTTSDHCDQIGAPYDIPVSETSDFSTDFHTFGMDWEPGLIIWYIDGIERFRTTQFVPVVNLSDPHGLAGMFLLLDLGIGKNYETPDPADFPQQMEVDYVRVYQKNPLTGTLHCPTQITVGQSGTFTLNGNDLNGNLQSANLLYSPNPPITNPNGDWTPIGSVTNCSGANCTGTVSWTPTSAGTYTLTATYFDTSGSKCTGNPFIPYASYPNANGYSACSNPLSDDSCTVRVVTSIPGDVNKDDRVDFNDFNTIKTYFDNPYTLFQYNDMVSNFET